MSEPRRILRLGRAPRGRRPPRPRRAAAVALVLLGALTYVVFGGRLPWAAAPYVLHADITANTELHIPSPVRIAGVDVGQVTGVSALPGSARVGRLTLHLDPGAPPIHRGATVTIRARTFLEGNFYVALTQGDPRAPRLASGSSLGPATGAGPVQLDRILSSLDAPARQALAADLRGLGTVFSPTAATAINRSLALSPRALTESSQVAQALVGQRPGDLTGVSAGLGRTFAALAASGDALPGLVDGLTHTMGALSRAETGLRGTVAALPGTLRAADGAETGLDATLPRLATVAIALEPGLRRLDPTILTAQPWLRSLARLLDVRHLGGLSVPLTPALVNGAAVIGRAGTLLTELDLLARCASRVLIPTGNAVIADPGAQPSGQPVYRELLQSAVGLASAAQNFDGNGRYLRSAIGGGATPVQTGTLPINGPLFGNAVLAPSGSRPALPARAPAIDLVARCAVAPAPNLNAVSTGGTP